MTDVKSVSSMEVPEGKLIKKVSWRPCQNTVWLCSVLHPATVPLINSTVVSQLFETWLAWKQTYLFTTFKLNYCVCFTYLNTIHIKKDCHLEQKKEESKTNNYHHLHILFEADNFSVQILQMLELLWAGFIFIMVVIAKCVTDSTYLCCRSCSTSTMFPFIIFQGILVHLISKQQFIHSVIYLFIISATRIDITVISLSLAIHLNFVASLTFPHLHVNLSVCKPFYRVPSKRRSSHSGDGAQPVSRGLQRLRPKPWVCPPLWETLKTTGCKRETGGNCDPLSTPSSDR